jgi:hypothetical protein
LNVCGFSRARSKERLQDLPEQALTILIEKKLAAQGVQLSKRQRELLTKQIMKGGKDTFRLQTWKWWDRRHVKLEFTPQDAEQIAGNFMEVIENRLPELIRTPWTKTARCRGSAKSFQFSTKQSAPYS